MKRTMDSKMREWTETWTDSSHGPSMWLLPAGSQFYTRSCTHCARLLPNARRYELKDDPENPEGIPCVHCGDLIDSMTLSTTPMGG
jgi:hypothetical protein